MKETFKPKINWDNANIFFLMSQTYVSCIVNVFKLILKHSSMCTLPLTASQSMAIYLPTFFSNRFIIPEQLIKLFKRKPVKHFLTLFEKYEKSIKLKGGLGSTICCVVGFRCVACFLCIVSCPSSFYGFKIVAIITINSGKVLIWCSGSKRGPLVLSRQVCSHRLK